VDFCGLGGPGRPGNLPKRWVASPPTFLEGVPAARGRLDPENRRSPVGQKIIHSKPRCVVQPSQWQPIDRRRTNQEGSLAVLSASGPRARPGGMKTSPGPGSLAMPDSPPLSPGTPLRSSACAKISASRARSNRGCTLAGNLELVKDPKIGHFGGLGGPGGRPDPKDGRSPGP